MDALVTVEIDLGKVCQENGASNHLVTRPTGRAVREAVEERLRSLGPRTLVTLDFSGVGIVDYSCADEVVAKLITRLQGQEYGEKFLRLKGLNPTQRENVEVALERKRLCIPAVSDGGALEVIGVLQPYLVETLRGLHDHGSLTARYLADLEDIELTTASTRLATAYKLRLMARREVHLEEGGRQFVYEPLA
ncbi:MAG: hypothetical protein RX318_02710 [bacterium]|nr:hypothetical protein [bacterium]